MYGAKLSQGLTDSSCGAISDKLNVPSAEEFCNLDSHSPDDSVLQFIHRHISASDVERKVLCDTYLAFLDSHCLVSETEFAFYIGIFIAFIEAGKIGKAVRFLTCGTKVATMECEHCGYKHPVSYNCKLRICSRCSRIRASECVKKYQTYINSLNPDSVRCLTLTMKNVTDLEDGVSKIRKHFVKLLHRKYYKGLIDGGLYHIEVTLNADSSYHVHLHCIVVGGYIPQKRLSDDWEFITGDSMVVWVERKDVTATLKYCLKHLLKKMKLSDNWTPSKLVEYEIALTDVRLIQPFGCFLGVLKGYKKEPFKCPVCGWVLWRITDESGKVVRSELGSMLYDYRRGKSP